MRNEQNPDLPTLKDKRWSLSRALAWIITRDLEKVQEVAADAHLMTLFIAQVRWTAERLPLPLHSDANEGWKLLSKRIAAGRVEASGRIFESNLKIGKPQPLGAGADGYALGKLWSERLDFPGLNIEGIHSDEQIVDIVVNVGDLVAAFPAVAPGQRTKSKGGRPPLYDWASAEAHAMELMDYHGFPSPNDAEFTQARLEAMISAFIGMQDPNGKEPAESTVRENVRKWMLKYRAKQANA